MGGIVAERHTPEILRKSLDRRVSFDPRSKQYPVTQLVSDVKLRSYSWATPVWLDQGQEGACVGFGWSHFLASRPKEEPNISNTSAEKLYNLAKTLDEWTGTNYDGTSTIAGAKAVVQGGYVKEYRWAFNTDDALKTLSHVGPLVIGINWYEDMFTPDPKTGIITPTGALAGGHCILVNGINIKKKLVKLHNSWGKDWGVNGECYLSFDDFDKILQDEGEACIALPKVLKSK